MQKQMVNMSFKVPSTVFNPMDLYKSPEPKKLLNSKTLKKA